MNCDAHLSADNCRLHVLIDARIAAFKRGDTKAVERLEAEIDRRIVMIGSRP
ncbi:hypothetical protein [Stenotrophomonas sp. PS02298]|uniref:hypothetical protein n=1 Tax=Stenotrophomonas sp. PS02298 TaxID=2991424 RepID=UPI00249BAF3B|nr:hypothetical protein [Stenotrophomonas sp. PS02298]